MIIARVTLEEMCICSDGFSRSRIDSSLARSTLRRNDDGNMHHITWSESESLEKREL